MQCLNTKNKEVAALLKEYTDILGSYNVAYYVLSENNGYGLDKAPNGADSKLFSDLLSHYNGDKVKAVQAKAKVYSDSFKNWFGDWINIDKHVDYNFFKEYADDNTTNGKLIKTLLDNYINPSDISEIIYGRFGVSGSYKTDSRKLTIPIDEHESLATRRKVAAHELMHIATAKYCDAYIYAKDGLKNYNVSKEYVENLPKLTEEQIKSFDRLSEIKQQVVDYINNNSEKVNQIRNKYGDIFGPPSYFMIDPENYNLHEFISEVFTNPALIELMSQLKGNYNKLSLFDKFVEALSKLFKFDISSTLFGDAVKEVSNILRSKTNVSKVVDENGEPLMVYHGGASGIDTFYNAKDNPNYKNTKHQAYTGYKSSIRVGIYFSKYLNVAKNYKAPYGKKGNIYPVFLSVKNPKNVSFTETLKNRLVRFGTLGLIKKPTVDAISENELETLYRDYDGVNHSSGTEIIVFDSNQIKSIDNQGTFSTQSDNIYNQSSASPTPVGTGRNQQLANILHELYPNITIGTLTDPNLRGQAQVEGNMAGRVLLNAMLENQDTLPHEYAHHYIAWFRNSPIVQKGIHSFGSEEALVQAIGENSVKAIKWYNRFFNWIKGLFNEKQATLNKLTNDFLHGVTQENSTKELLREIHNQTLNSGTTEIPQSVIKTVSKLRKAIESRINTLEHSSIRNPKILSNLEGLLNRFDQFDAFESVLAFAGYMRSDVEDALVSLRNYTKLFLDYEKGLLPDMPITVSQMDLISKGTIKFYSNLYSNLQNLVESPEVKEYMEAAYPNTTVYEDTINQLKNVAARYGELARYYNELENKIAEKLILEEATRQGSTTVDELKKALSDGIIDIRSWGRYAAQTQYSSSELVRLLLNKISEAKYRVYDRKLAKAKELLDILSKVNKSELALLFEKDKEGKRTGNFTRSLNFGEHENKYKAHMTKVLNDLGVRVPEGISFGDIPSILNPEQLKKWNAEKNKWDSANSERRFVPAYYDIMNSLSEDARAKKDSITLEIHYLLDKTIDEDGYYHLEDLSDEEYAKYVALKNQKANLASPFYMDGTAKTGKDKEIASEIREYNKKLRDKVKYVYNLEKFKEAEARAKASLTPEKFKLWKERNTRERISEQFYEDIRKLSSVPNKSKDQLAYEAVRSQYIKMYTFDGHVDPSVIPESVKEFINQLDDLIAEEAYRNREKGRKSRVMEIAKWEIDPNFYKEMEIAFSKSQAEFDEWVRRNGRYDREGNIIPASFWKKLVPKDKSKYVEVIPSDAFTEVDKSSEFYNNNFDESYGVARVPKRSLYDNSKNFNKIKGNTKVLYDALLSTMEEANSFLPFMKNTNKGQMAQIEGGIYRQIAGADGVLNGLGHALLGGIEVREQDEQYNINKALEPDGSPVRLVPTRYMKKLSNPNMITDDVVGATILYYGMAVNHEEMTKIAPEMEVIINSVSRREFIDERDSSIIPGISSKTHAKLREMVDDFIYGMFDNPRLISMSMGGKKLDISVDKALNNLGRFTRVNGLGNNLYVILTGLITNKIQSRLDAIAGIYYDNKSLAKASLEIQKSYGSALANVGNPNSKNKAMCVLEWSGTVSDINYNLRDLHRGRFGRAIQKRFFYGGYAMADYITKGKISLAIMMHYKFVPEKGRFMNRMQFLAEYEDKSKAEVAWNSLTTTLYDAFEVDNNVLKVKPEYEKYLDELTKTRVRNTIKQVCTRIDSQLSDLDKNYLSSNVFWKLVFMYRNFILINLQTKFGTKRQYNYSTGMWTEAQYRGAFNYIWRHYIDKDRIETLKEMYRNYDQLNELERRLAKRSLYEVLFCVFGMYFLSMIFKGIAEDDNDDWWKNTIALLALRSAIESRGNIIPLEALNMISSPTATWTTVEQMINMIKTLFNDPNDIITSGNYKGLRRWQRSLIKLTPFRAIYETKDPQYKLKYYDNLISIF